MITFLLIVASVTLMLVVYVAFVLVLAVEG